MIWEIAKREIVGRVRTKAFRIVTGILVLLAIAGPLLVLLLPSGDDEALEITIGVAGEVEPGVVAALGGIETEEFLVVVEPFVSRDEAETAVSAGDVEAALVSIDGEPTTIYDSSVDPLIEALIASSYQSAAIADAGLSNEQLDALFRPRSANSVLLDESSIEDDIGTGIAIFAVIFTFIGIQTYGALMVMSVIEEKSTRVVEVLLAHVKPQQLLAGKILGTAAIAIAQLFLLVGALAVMLLVTQDVDIPARLWASLPLLAVTFILGFLLYAVLFAAGGSLLSRQEDSQQVLMPLLIPLIGAYIYGTSTVTSPDTLGVKVLSFIPFSSPMFLPIRTSVGEIAIWEVAVSLLILVVSVVILLQLAAKIYSYALLRTGTRVSIRGAFWESSVD